MLLKLANIDVFMIQIIGRWKSDAFMRYIRKQIQEFTSGITDNIFIMFQETNHYKKTKMILSNKDGRENPLIQFSSPSHNKAR